MSPCRACAGHDAGRLVSRVPGLRVRPGTLRLVIAVTLALTSALAYGASDFVAGVSARRSNAWAVAAACQLASLVVVALAAWVAATGSPRVVDFAWGVVGGVGNALGTAFLYRGLATGRVSVVAPVSAVGAALVPVAAGLVFGERLSPLTWVGVAAALPGIWCVSRVADAPEVHGPGSRARNASALRDAVVAGLGFGVLFVALGRVPRDAGLTPVAVCQLVALVTLLAVAVSTRNRLVAGGVAGVGGLVAGALSAGANLTYLFATQSGTMTVAAVLTALYPAVTILLAAAILRERIDGVQGLGLLFCAAAVGLVAAG